MVWARLLVQTAVVSPVVVWVLSALGIVVVALTRVRLGTERSLGSRKISRGVLHVHTVAGVLGLGAWIPYLCGAPLWAGFVGLSLCWVTALAGLGLLARWMPSGGRHANDDAEDSWAEGPGLSVLAHGGLALGMVVNTVAFALGVV